MIDYHNNTESNTVLNRPIKGDKLNPDELKGEVNTGASIFDPNKEIHKILQGFTKTGDSKEQKITLPQKTTIYSPKVTKLPISAEIELFDESFLLIKKGDEIHLKHQTWSLAGFGETVQDAIQSLRKNGKELLSVFEDLNNEELSQEALDMVYFLKVYFRDE